MLLLTRLLALAALVIAFSRPVKLNSDRTDSSGSPYLIYLDNSFSMQAQRQGMSLLEYAIQLLVKEIPENQLVELFTNDRTFGPDTWGSLRNKVTGLSATHQKRFLDEILLRASESSELGPKYAQVLLISDFQVSNTLTNSVDNSSENWVFLPLRPETYRNAWIDSMALGGVGSSSLKMQLWVRGGMESEILGISVYEDRRLLAKTTAEAPGPDQERFLEINIPPVTELNGRVEVDDKSLVFDNQFYFSLNQAERIKVLAVGKASGNHLERIYINEKFDFNRQELNRLDFGLIPRQNLILLDQLETIPNSLQEALLKYYKDGGSICIIPHKKSRVTDYSQLLSSLGNYAFSGFEADTLRIDGIRDNHPLFQDVFSKKVENYEAPEVQSYYRIGPSSQSALILENEQPFLISGDRISIFSSPIDPSCSNFSLSPLIVPTFFNMGKQSIRIQDLYVRMGSKQRVDFPFSTPADQVIRLRSDDFEYIPRQRSFPNRTEMYLEEEIPKAGLFTLIGNKDSLGTLAINHPQSESVQNWLDIEETERNKDLGGLLKSWRENNKRTEYWKWAIGIALLMLLTEMCIQKWMK